MTIPLETLSGKKQNVSHLRVFGAKCWAKILTVHGIQVTGGLKLDPRAIECRLLGYAGGHGNYKVQDVATNHVFVSHDIVFKEGQPNRTSPNVGEKTIPLFDVELGETSSEETTGIHTDQPTDQQDIEAIPKSHVKSDDRRADIPVESIQQTEPEIRRSTRTPKPSAGILQSKEYQQREEMGRHKGEEWTTQAGLTCSNLSEAQDDYIACLAETKASHNIPQSY